MERPLKIGLLLVALTVALVVVAPGQVGLWLWANYGTVLAALVIVVGGLWVSNAIGLTTADRVAVTSNVADALAVTGGQTIGGNLVVTGGQTIGGSSSLSGDLTIQKTDPIVLLRDISEGIDAQRWLVYAQATEFRIDAQSNVGGTINALKITRSGVTPTALIPGVRINSGAAQPGFLVFLSTNQSVPPITGVTIPFDSEIYDTTGNFASNTFTAPVTGIYLLSLVVAIEPTSNNIPGVLLLVTSNRSYRVRCSASGSQSGASNSASVCVCADMDAGDTATVFYQSLDGSGPNIILGGGTPYNSYFTGRLMP